MLSLLQFRHIRDGGLKGSAKHLQLIYGLGGVCYGTTLESVRGATRRALATI
jgi:hypothetical protein